MVEKEIILDTGADPLGNGKYRMYPSGDIVDEKESLRRLPPVDMSACKSPLILGRTWAELNAMQQKLWVKQKGVKKW